MDGTIKQEPDGDLDMSDAYVDDELLGLFMSAGGVPGLLGFGAHNAGPMRKVSADLMPRSISAPDLASLDGPGVFGSNPFGAVDPISAMARQLDQTESLRQPRQSRARLPPDPPLAPAPKKSRSRPASPPSGPFASPISAPTQRSVPVGTSSYQKRPGGRGSLPSTGPIKSRKFPRGMPLNDNQEKAAKRLARKASLARQSRRRKKQYVQDLERKVQVLGEKIEELQRQLSSSQTPSTRTKHPPISDKDKALSDQQKKIRERMGSVLKTQGDGPDVEPEIGKLVDQFIQNSRKRQQQVEYYFDKVEDCITPGLQTKFALWGLDQADDFYEKPGLWQSLMSTEMGLSNDQMSKLKSRRSAIRTERKELAMTEQMLRELRAHSQQHLERLNLEVEHLRTILSPIQLAKFFVWVEENEWCMQMLNTVWQGQAGGKAGPAR